MKQNASHYLTALLTGVFAFLPWCVGVAEDTNSTASEVTAAQPTTSSAAVVTTSAAPKLPYGAEDVLKLSRAQIGEEIILNYVQNSGTIYNLAPRDIVYLRDQGVSDKVVSAMLNQRKRVELAAQNTAASAIQNAPEVPNAPSVSTAPTAYGAASGPGYADPNATYAEAPLTPPASSVYVMPYSGATYPYYGPYGYYPYYYGGWYGPSVAFGFRFGGHGGFHGGHGSFGGHGGSGGHHR